jgi:hypothetical protein
VVAFAHLWTAHPRTGVRTTRPGDDGSDAGTPPPCWPRPGAPARREVVEIGEELRAVAQAVPPVRQHPHGQLHSTSRHREDTRRPHPALHAGVPGTGAKRTVTGTRSGASPGAYRTATASCRCRVCEATRAAGPARCAPGPRARTRPSLPLCAEVQAAPGHGGVVIGPNPTGPRSVPHRVQASYKPPSSVLRSPRSCRRSTRHRPSGTLVDARSFIAPPPLRRGARGRIAALAGQRPKLPPAAKPPIPADELPNQS